jgi:hypothetical protein
MTKSDKNKINKKGHQKQSKQVAKSYKDNKKSKSARKNMITMDYAASIDRIKAKAMIEPLAYHELMTGEKTQFFKLLPSATVEDRQVDQQGRLHTFERPWTPADTNRLYRENEETVKRETDALRQRAKVFAMLLAHASPEVRLELEGMPEFEQALNESDLTLFMAAYKKITDRAARLNALEFRTALEKIKFNPRAETFMQFKTRFNRMSERVKKGGINLSLHNRTQILIKAIKDVKDVSSIVLPMYTIDEEDLTQAKFDNFMEQLGRVFNSTWLGNKKRKRPDDDAYGNPDSDSDDGEKGYSSTSSADTASSCDASGSSSGSESGTSEPRRRKGYKSGKRTEKSTKHVAVRTKHQKEIDTVEKRLTDTVTDTVKTLFAEAKKDFGKFARKSQWRNKDDKSDDAKDAGEKKAFKGKKPLKLCFNCKGDGHYSLRCKKPDHPCTKCGKKGHLEEFCEPANKFLRYADKEVASTKMVTFREIGDHLPEVCTLMVKVRDVQSDDAEESEGADDSDIRAESVDGDSEDGEEYEYDDSDDDVPSACGSTEDEEEDDEYGAPTLDQRFGYHNYKHSRQGTTPAPKLTPVAEVHNGFQINGEGTVYKRLDGLPLHAVTPSVGNKIPERKHRRQHVSKADRGPAYSSHHDEPGRKPASGVAKSQAWNREISATRPMPGTDNIIVKGASKGNRDATERLKQVLDIRDRSSGVKAATMESTPGRPYRHGGAPTPWDTATNDRVSAEPAAAPPYQFTQEELEIRLNAAGRGDFLDIPAIPSQYTNPTHAEAASLYNPDYMVWMRGNLRLDMTPTTAPDTEEASLVPPHCMFRSHHVRLGLPMPGETGFERRQHREGGFRIMSVDAMRESPLYRLVPQDIVQFAVLQWVKMLRALLFDTMQPFEPVWYRELISFPPDHQLYVLYYAAYMHWKDKMRLVYHPNEITAKRVKTAKDLLGRNVVADLLDEFQDVCRGNWDQVRRANGLEQPTGPLEYRGAPLAPLPGLPYGTPMSLLAPDVQVGQKWNTTQHLRSAPGQRYDLPTTDNAMHAGEGRSAPGSTGAYGSYEQPCRALNGAASAPRAKKQRVSEFNNWSDNNFMMETEPAQQSSSSSKPGARPAWAAQSDCAVLKDAETKQPPPRRATSRFDYSTACKHCYKSPCECKRPDEDPDDYNYDKRTSRRFASQGHKYAPLEDKPADTSGISSNGRNSRSDADYQALRQKALDVYQKQTNTKAAEMFSSEAWDLEYDGTRNVVVFGPERAHERFMDIIVPVYRCGNEELKHLGFEVFRSNMKGPYIPLLMERSGGVTRPDIRDMYLQHERRRQQLLSRVQSLNELRSDYNRHDWTEVSALTRKEFLRLLEIALHRRLTLRIATFWEPLLPFDDDELYLMQDIALSMINLDPEVLESIESPYRSCKTTYSGLTVEEQAAAIRVEPYRDMSNVQGTVQFQWVSDDSILRKVKDVTVLPPLGHELSVAAQRDVAYNTLVSSFANTEPSEDELRQETAEITATVNHIMSGNLGQATETQPTTTTVAAETEQGEQAAELEEPPASRLRSKKDKHKTVRVYYFGNGKRVRGPAMKVQKYRRPVVDSGASVHVETSPYNLRGFVRQKERRMIMTTANGQEMMVEQVGYVPGYGTVAIVRGATDRIVSVPQLTRNGYAVTFDKRRAVITGDTLTNAVVALIGGNDHYKLDREDMDTLLKACELGATTADFMDKVKVQLGAAALVGVEVEAAAAVTTDSGSGSVDTSGPGALSEGPTTGSPLTEGPIDEVMQQTLARNGERAADTSDCNGTKEQLLGPDGTDELAFLSDNVSVQAEALATNVAGEHVLVLTPEQLLRTEQVIVLHNASGHPSDASLSNALLHGHLVGTKLTPRDVELARAYWGPCRACAAGKTVKQSFSSTDGEPASRIGEKVYADIYFLSGDSADDNVPSVVKSSECRTMLLCVDAFSSMLHIVKINDKKLRSVQKGFKKILAQYALYGHKIDEIHCDAESVLRAADEWMAYRGIKLRQSPPYQHCQRVERYVRTIKQRVRCLEAQAPVVLPSFLKCETTRTAVHMLNDFATKIKEYTPRMMFEGVRCELSNRSLLPYGTVGIVYAPENKDAKAHIAVWLGPAPTSPNCNLCYVLSTDRFVTRQTMTPLTRIEASFPWQRQDGVRNYAAPRKRKHGVTVKLNQSSTENLNTAPEPGSDGFIRRNEVRPEIQEMPRHHVQNATPDLPREGDEDADEYDNENTEMIAEELQTEQLESSYDTMWVNYDEDSNSDEDEPKSPAFRRVRSESEREASLRATKVRLEVDKGRKREAAKLAKDRKHADMRARVAREILEREIARNEDEQKLAEVRLRWSSVQQGENPRKPTHKPEHAQAGDATITAQPTKASASQHDRASKRVSPTVIERLASQSATGSRNSEVSTGKGTTARNGTDYNATNVDTHSTTERMMTRKRARLLEPVEDAANRTDKAQANETGRRARVKAVDSTTGRSAGKREASRSYRISVKEALKGDRAQESKEAIIAEIMNMLEYQVGHYVTKRDIPHDKRGNIITCFMFLKHKTLPDGSYDKTKARLVGNGANQKAHMYDMISSSTVALSSVFLLFNLASYYQCTLASFDIKGAFLHAKFGETDETTYIRIPKEIAELWVKQDPSAVPFLESDGTLLLELDKFIYGLKQSPYKFGEHLTAVLISLGYERLVHDPCLFVRRGLSEEQFSVCSTHVDDILQACSSLALYEELRDGLVKAYGEITSNPAADAYLGMTIERTSCKKFLKLTQCGLVDRLVESYPRGARDSCHYSSAAAADLFEAEGHTDAASLNGDQRREFLSVVMTLMYLARLTRPDVLLATTYLASRTHKADARDVSDVRRVIRYLEKTRKRGVVINCTSLQLYLKCDASYGTHSPGANCYGHTGYLVGFGSDMSYLHARSGKQKVGSTSSTDAEIIALVDAVKMCVWLREILRECKLVQLSPIVAYEDNMSAIHLTAAGSAMKRSKHLMTKITYLQWVKSSGALEVVHLATELQTADVLSKPLQGAAHQTHVDNMMGHQWWMNAHE